MEFLSKALIEQQAENMANMANMEEGNYLETKAPLRENEAVSGSSNGSGTASPKVDVPPVSPFGEYPEGGRRAWMTVGGASACLFVSFGWVNCAGIFQDYYQLHQLHNYTPSEIAWIPALQSEYMQ